MNLDEIKHELNLCTPKEQDTLNAYLLYLRLKRTPKDLQNLHHKIDDSSLESWSEQLFKPAQNMNDTL